MKKSNIIIFIISLIITLPFLLVNNNIKPDVSKDVSLSYINIMNTNYVPLRDYALSDYFINDYKEKEDQLKTIFKSKPITSRLKYRASLISHLGEEEIIINGIDIKSENEVFDYIDNDIIKNFDPDNSIIISSSAASILDVNTDDKIILKIIDKGGYYKAEEYNIIAVIDDLNYNYALIDINNLNNFSGLKNSASEIYIKHDIKNLEKYDDDIKSIFGNDFGIYLKTDLGSYDNDDFKNLNTYIILTYFLILFSIYIFMNSYSNNDNNNNDFLFKIIFSLTGFIAAFLIYFILVKLYYKESFIFLKLYLLLFIINIFSVSWAYLKYSILEKMFINKISYKIEIMNINSIISKNILILLGITATYIFAFIIIYLSFSGFASSAYNKDSNKTETLLSSNENIVKIVKNNTSKNTFLFDGAIDSLINTDSEIITNSISNNIINNIIKEINDHDQYAEIERVLTFPIGVVIRTGSIASRAYTYEKNILENGIAVSNALIDGRIFDSEKKEIIIGKKLADYLKLKNGDPLSIIAKASRGWLETSYFTVVGIFDIEDKNYDIIGDFSAMSSFIYLREGNKSPYNESIAVFSDNKGIYSYLNENSVIKEYNLKADANINNKSSNNSSKNIILVFIIIISFSVSMLCSSILSILYRRLNCLYNESNDLKKILKVLYMMLFFISVILSNIIILLFVPFSFNFIIFTISVLILSFILSMLISNYNII